MIPAPYRQQLVNFALIAAAIALGALLYFTRDRVTTAEVEARSRHVLGAFREQAVTRIRIERPAEKIELARSVADAGSEGFQLLAPVTEPADAYAVDKLLGSLEFATRIRSIEPSEVDRARFGLDQPKQVLLLEMGAIRYVLRFGAEAASPKGAVYVDVGGSGAPRPGVVLVSGDLARELMPALDELREKQIVPYSSTGIDRLVLDGAGGRRQLHQPVGRPWRFQGQSADLRIGRAAMDALLLELARAKAEHFLPLQQARQLQSTAAERVDVEVVPRDPKQPRALLSFGGACPKSPNDVLAVRSQPRPIAGCVPKTVATGLAVPADELVDRALIALRADEIERLELQAGPKRFVLVRTESGFTLEAGGKSAVELEAGNRRLSELAAARGRIVDRPNLTELGLAPALGLLEVRSATDPARGGLPSERLRFSAAIGGRVSVLREQDGAVLELTGESVRALSSDTTLLRGERVLELDPAQVQSIEVQSQSWTQRAERLPSGGFRLTAPAGHAIDEGLVSELLEALSHLDAERWAADSEAAGMGLGSPSLDVRLALDDQDGGARQLRLVVGSPTSGGFYARLEPDPAVFVLARGVSERLSKLLLDRSVFSLDPAAARSVELESKGRTLRLEKSGEHFTARASPELGPDRVAEIIDVLTTLRPEAAIHLGPPQRAEGFGQPALVVRIVAEAGPLRTFRIGAADSFHDMAVRHARADGIDASYVIASSKLGPLLDPF